MVKKSNQKVQEARQEKWNNRRFHVNGYLPAFYEKTFSEVRRLLGFKDKGENAKVYQVVIDIAAIVVKAYRQSKVEKSIVYWLKEALNPSTKKMDADEKNRLLGAANTHKIAAMEARETIKKLGGDVKELKDSVKYLETKIKELEEENEQLKSKGKGLFSFTNRRKAS